MADHLILHEARIGVHALMLLFHNWSPDRMVHEVYRGSDPSYLEQKVDFIVKRGMPYRYGYLDAGNQRRLVVLAMEHYGEQATDEIRRTP